jgi:hypothetical protein
MKTIYDHKSLLVRLPALSADGRVFFEKSTQCDRAERLRRSTPPLPTLQCPHADRQTSVNENGCRLRLAQSIDFTPPYKLFNHGWQVFRDFRALTARFFPLNVRVLVEESRQCCRRNGLRRPMAYFPVLQGPELHRESRLRQYTYRLRLTEVIGCAPPYELLNHGRKVSRHRLPTMTNAAADNNSKNYATVSISVRYISTLTFGTLPYMRPGRKRRATSRKYLATGEEEHNMRLLTTVSYRDKSEPGSYSVVHRDYGKI